MTPGAQRGGNVWLSEDGKKLYMNRCPKCKTENYAANVAVAICAWCGYKATKEDAIGNSK